jgi:hypothetical protein
MKCSCTVPEPIITDQAEMISITTPKARKEHICSECHRIINKAEEYRREFYKYDNKTDISKLCEDCLSVREVFFSSGWYYGELWNQINEFINDNDGDLSVSCLLMLTKPARDKILDLIELQWSGE